MGSIFGSSASDGGVLFVSLRHHGHKRHAISFGYVSEMPYGGVRELK